MNEVLSSIGLFSIAAFIIYIAKKVDDYCYSKSLEDKQYYIDKDEDDDDIL